MALVSPTPFCQGQGKPSHPLPAYPLIFCTLYVWVYVYKNVHIYMYAQKHACSCLSFFRTHMQTHTQTHTHAISPFLSFLHMKQNPKKNTIAPDISVSEFIIAIVAASLWIRMYTTCSIITFIISVSRSLWDREKEKETEIKRGRTREIEAHTRSHTHKRTHTHAY